MKVKILPTGNPREQGSILITVIILLSTLTIYGAVLITVVFERSMLIHLELDRLQSLYLAEAGIAKSIQEIKTERDPGNNGLGTIAVTKLGRGTYAAQHEPGTLSILGIGNVNDIERSVRVYYEGI